MALKSSHANSTTKEFLQETERSGEVEYTIDLETFERKRGLLPPVPDILSRLDSALQKGDATVPQVSELISSDVSIVARILRIANSAYYGLPKAVSDLEFAIAFLGFAEIHRIVLTASVAEAFRGADREHLKRFWFHSYYTALVARHLSGVFERHLEPGVLWPAALLHDLGELVYMQLFPDEYSQLLQYREQQKCLYEDAEAEICVASHKQLGALLCDYWKLPELVKDICLHHDLHDPQSVPGSNEMVSIRRLVSAADLLSLIAAEPLRPDVEEELQARVRTLLACSERDFGVILKNVVTLREEVERFSAALV